jgi:hypothetical protein
MLFLVGDSSHFRISRMDHLEQDTDFLETESSVDEKSYQPKNKIIREKYEDQNRLL